jgi:hypothetical protein
MNNLSLADLHAFIVRAKAATYVGGGAKIPSCRTASHDLQYTEGDWRYLSVTSAAPILSARRLSGMPKSLPGR